jgi:ABC-type lipoprotein release transport system permease subunit
MMSTTGNRIALDVSPGWRTVTFALGLALLTAAISAVVPAVRAGPPSIRMRR